MARYTDEYEGTPGGFRPPRGMDPNYRGGYGGMRMGGRHEQAEYGRYRMHHRRDFEGSGGLEGGYGGYYHGHGPRYARDYHPEWQGGGVHDVRYDREFLRDYNANSPMLRRERGRYDDQMGPRGRAGEALERTHWGFDPRYANRGLSTGGYAEGWARGPMRGAR